MIQCLYETCFCLLHGLVFFIRLFAATAASFLKQHFVTDRLYYTYKEIY